jgi:hypothetical protein
MLICYWWINQWWTKMQNWYNPDSNCQRFDQIDSNTIAIAVLRQHFSSFNIFILKSLNVKMFYPIIVKNNEIETMIFEQFRKMNITLIIIGSQLSLNRNRFNVHQNKDNCWILYAIKTCYMKDANEFQNISVLWKMLE